MQRRIEGERSTMTEMIQRLGNFGDTSGLPNISKVVAYNGLVYTSGVTGEPNEDIVVQTQQALHRIDSLLELAGTDRSRILSAQVWLADMSDFTAHNAVWDAWVDAAHAPARACVGAQLYKPGLLVEVRVVAIAGDTDVRSTTL
jgi:enamine deaminase RidA (YjgF/YER057c/UK114 family)